MKIGIVADSHDHVHKIRSAEEWIRDEKIDLLIHAGDYVSPFALKELLLAPVEFIGVFGNNDGDRLLLNKVSQGRIHVPPYELSLPHLRVMILHEPPALEAISLSGLFDLVIYGHMHEAVLKQEGPTCVFNPGELGGWLYGRSTVGLYDSNTRQGQIIEI